MQLRSSRTFPGQAYAKQLLGGRRGDSAHALPGRRGDLLDQPLRQQEHVVAPRAQRRQIDADDVDPIVEIRPEAPALDLRLEIAIGGADEPRVERAFVVAAHRADATLFERAQELGLQAGRRLADLVEKQRSAARLQQETGPAGARVGERSARVATGRVDDSVDAQIALGAGAGPM